ncbi:MAG: hypothetical protein RI947_901 [Candidatus Parcubacteria bacterium]
MKPTKHIYLFSISIALVLIAGAITYVYYHKTSRSLIAPLLSTTKPLSSPSPTPMAFRELTVPYLRERSYKSELNDLEPAYENSAYKAYVTSYDSDGLQINGLLTQPTGDKPAKGWPAIVFIHGYIPPTQYETQGKPYASYVDYLARNGFVVFKIDLRGHGNSEGEPGGAYYSSDYSIDALNAYNALQNSSFVDPHKIGLWGHSMAGNVTLRAMAGHPEIPAAVIWAGAVYSYTDQQEYGINDASYQPPPNDTQRQQRRKLLFDTYGPFNSDSPFWKQVAPTNYIKDLSGAIQIHHAVDDAVVNIGYSRNLNILLNKTSVPHELHEYATGGHNISGASFNEAMEQTVEFFRKYLT